MLPHTHSLASPLVPGIFPSQPFKSIYKSTHFNPTVKNPSAKSSHHTLRCSSSATQAVPKEQLHLHHQHSKPSPAEVSRTIMELSSVGTLSTLTDEGWPLGVGVRFLVDAEGGPVLCLNAAERQFSADGKSSLHVQLERCGSRTPQCTLLGSLNKPEDRLTLKKLHALWEKRFGEEVDEDLFHVVSVERILQMDNFREVKDMDGGPYPCVDGIWVTLSEYVTANPDPLRSCAERIVNEMNAEHKEDVHRFCNVFVDLGFQMMEAKMIWVDRLGFDVHLHAQNGIFEVRIPFPREVTDEKGVKSSFNCMSQLAWEVERNYTVPDFEKVKQLKEIGCVTLQA